MFDRMIARLRSWLAGFEPARLSGPAAVRLVETLTELERLVAAARSLCAARAAETQQWRLDGHRSAEGWLAGKTGVGLREARESLDTAARLREQPDVDAAVRDGRLSGPQASLVTEAVAADPSASAELLAAAPNESLTELRRRAERVKSAARSAEDEAAQRARIHRERYVRTSVRDGVFEIHGRGPAEEGALWLARMQPFIDEQFKLARQEGRREEPDAYAWDALLAMSQSGGSATSPAKVIFRADLSAALRGTTVPGEVCEIAGFGSVPVAAVLEQLPAAFLALVLSKGKDVHTVVHLGRGFTEFQQTALEWRDPECCVKGCSVGVRLEKDHVTGWAETRTTAVPDGQRLCHHHHLLKTKGWRVEPLGDGTIGLVPPREVAAVVGGHDPP